MIFEAHTLAKPIPGFENYFIHEDGNIVNVNTGREMVLSPSHLGDLIVGLHKGGRQYTRSVKVLVAEAFVPGQSDLFDTPIQLNHNKEDIRASNIRWRPRWFAWKYFHQFEEIEESYLFYPVREINSGTEYDNIFQAATTSGLLFIDVQRSIRNEFMAWPTGERFEYI